MERWRDVLATGDFVLGNEVARFETWMSHRCAGADVISLNSGTDALILALRGLGIGPGDEVIAYHCPRLLYYHQLEREHIHLLLIEDASKGLADVSARKVKDARSTLSAIKRRRTKAAGSRSPASL